MDQEINRAIRANENARNAIQRLVDERPDAHSQQFLALSVKAAMSMATNLQALMEIERIIHYGIQ